MGGLIKGFGGASASDAGKANTDSDDNNDKYTPPAPTSAPVVYKSTAPPKIVYTPSPRPAPVTYKPSPAPIKYRPAPPVVYRPAPVVYKPAPIVYRPAPTPVPVTYKPAASYVEPKYNDVDAVYTWEYAVKDDYTNNDFGHKESRNGAHTDGKYYVALPDGRLQTVTYTVDGYSGYVPQVEYAGEAHYADAKPYSA